MEMCVNCKNRRIREPLNCNLRGLLGSKDLMHKDNPKLEGKQRYVTGIEKGTDEGTRKRERERERVCIIFETVRHALTLESPGFNATWETIEAFF